MASKIYLSLNSLFLFLVIFLFSLIFTQSAYAQTCDAWRPTYSSLPSCSNRLFQTDCNGSSTYTGTQCCTGPDVAGGPFDYCENKTIDPLPQYWFRCCNNAVPSPSPSPLPSPSPSPVISPSPSPSPAGCQNNAQCGTCKQCCAGSPNYCTSYGYYCAGGQIPGCWASPSPSPSSNPSPSPSGSCPVMGCSYTQNVPVATCASGTQIVTGNNPNGCTGRNVCTPCNYINGCSDVTCYVPGASPSPSPGGGGSGCYNFKCKNDGPTYTNPCADKTMDIDPSQCTKTWCLANQFGNANCDPNGTVTCTSAASNACNPGPDPDPIPACDASKVTMSFSPLSPIVGQPITFTVSGTQGFSHVGDTFSGGVSCPGFPITWPTSQTCTTIAANSYTWTHSWKNCRPNTSCQNANDIGPQCSKPLPYAITIPISAWIQVTGDVHSNTKINATGGP